MPWPGVKRRLGLLDRHLTRAVAYWEGWGGAPLLHAAGEAAEHGAGALSGNPLGPPLRSAAAPDAQLLYLLGPGRRSALDPGRVVRGADWFGFR